MTYLARMGVSISAFAVLVGCSSGTTDVAGPNSTSVSPPSTETSDSTFLNSLTPTADLGALYLEAVCTSRNARLLVYSRAEGYLANGTSTLESVLEAVPDAVETARRAHEVLSDTSIVWPEEVRTDLGTIAQSELDSSNALETSLSGASVNNFDTVWQQYLDRPKGANGDGERVRAFFGLGQRGDCPKGENANEIYLALVLQASPTLTNRTPGEVIALGQQVCSMGNAGLSEDLVFTELESAGLQAFEIGTVVGAAQGVMCPTAIGQTTEESPS